MVFLSPREEVKHVCKMPDAPVAFYAEGTRWMCEDYDCNAIYCVEMVRDRGVSNLEWVLE